MSSNLRVLVMDDDKGVCRMFERMLKEVGHDVLTASDPDEAVALYRNNFLSKNPPDLVILDLYIAGIGSCGVETLAKLRKINPKVPAILCSGSIYDEAFKSAVDNGFNAVLSKPFDSLLLSEIIRTLF